MTEPTPSAPRTRRSRYATRARALPSDRLQYALLVAVTALLRMLGVDRAAGLMGFLWRRLAPFNARHRRAAANLALALPHLAPAERERILGDAWDNLGRTAAESLLLPELVADRRRFDVRTEAIEPHRAEIEKGAVFASLHMGNWELCGWGIHLAGFRVAAVYQSLKNPLAEALLRERRVGIYDAGLYPRDEATALKLRSLARGGVAVGMLADLRDHSGLTIPFFGRDTRAASFPAVLARRLGVPLIVGRTVRLAGSTFRIEARRVDVPVTDDAEADIRAATIALHGQFEAWIADNPGQWMWATKKWPGQTGAY